MNGARRARRGWLAAAAGCAAWLACGCASEGVAPQPARPGHPQRFRTLQGGFLSPALLSPAPPAAGVTGLYVRWIAPSAIAISGHELLVADVTTQRLWRTDVSGQLITAIAGAPVIAGMQLAIGPDLSAWLLDPIARQVLRFSRDGRLVQTLRMPLALPTPSALLLADGGATLLVADGIGATFGEQRGAALVRTISPETATGQRISSSDGLAAAPAGVWVLDRLAGAVHEVSREGRVLRTLGQGELMQPTGIASDRFGNVWVHDAQDLSIKRLRGDAPLLRIAAAELGVQRIGAIAADGALLAVADPIGGQVVLLTIPR